MRSRLVDGAGWPLPIWRPPDQLDQRLGVDAEPSRLGDHRFDVLLGELLAAQLDQPVLAPVTTNIPMPRRFSSIPLSTSMLMPLAAVAGLIR